MTKYAKDTAVPVERSRAEIERILERWGADAFLYGWNAQGAVVQFRAHGRHIRFVLPLPPRDSKEFTEYMRGYSTYQRTEDAARRAWEQACRQRWRALALVIKAKLEAVESGIAFFEDEFLAYIALPNGQSVGDWMRPQVKEAYDSGLMPSELQLALPRGSDT